MLLLKKKHAAAIYIKEKVFIVSGQDMTLARLQIKQASNDMRFQLSTVQIVLPMYPSASVYCRYANGLLISF